MHVTARMPGKSRLGFANFVGCVTVHHQKRLEFLPQIGFDLVQKAQELLVAMPARGVASDYSGGQVKSREQ